MTFGIEAEPGPAASKLAGGRFGKGLLKSGEVFEVVIDGLAQIVAWFGALVFPEARPKEGMVDVAAAVIADHGTNFFRHGVQICEQAFHGAVGEVGVLSQGFVQVGEIGLVMFVVMDLHRLGIDMRLQGVGRVWQGRQRDGCRSDRRGHQG